MTKQRRSLRVKITNHSPPPSPRDLAFLTWHRALSFAAIANSAEVEILRTEPVYFLFGHAIELGLKAFLISTGLSEKECKKFGHDLDAAARAAVVAGLHISKEDIETASFLTDAYDAPHSFRYFNDDGWAAPPLQNVADCCGHILTAVREKL